MIQKKRAPPGVKEAPTRVFDTEYQNGNRWRLALISFQAVWNLANDIALVKACKKASAGVAVTDNPNTFGMFSPAAVSQSLSETAYIIIPPKWYYNCITSVSGNGTITLARWSEVDL